MICSIVIRLQESMKQGNKSKYMYTDVHHSIAYSREKNLPKFFSKFTISLRIIYNCLYQVLKEKQQKTWVFVSICFHISL